MSPKEKNVKRVILIFMACLALILGTSIPAQAYSSTRCNPTWGGYYARLSVTSWNSSHYEGSLWVREYTYHVDMNPSGNYHASTIFKDGYNLYRTNDFYVYENEQGHRWTGRWYVWPAGSHGELGYKYCTVWL
jgi:hypothetical protein